MPKIKNATGGKDKDDLLNLDIDSQIGGGYKITGPNNDALSSTNQTTLPVTFPAFQYDGWTWTITITAQTGNNFSGGWENNDPDPTAGEGTWTTGSGTDVEAASATP